MCYKDFYIRTFRGYADMEIVDNSVRRLEHVYSFSKLPEGFTLTGGYKDTSSIWREYTDGDGVKWYLNQQAAGVGFDVRYDTKDGSLTKSDSIYFYSREGFTYTVWMKDGYLMELYCYKDVDRETMKVLIGAIE